MSKLKYFIRLYQASYDILSSQEKADLAQKAAACKLFIFSSEQVGTTDISGLYGLQTDFFNQKNPFDESLFLSFLSALFNSNIDLQKSDADVNATLESIIKSYTKDFCARVGLSPVTTSANAVIRELLNGAKELSFPIEALAGDSGSLRSYVHRSSQREEDFIILYLFLLDVITGLDWQIGGGFGNPMCWKIYPKKTSEKSYSELFNIRTLINDLLCGQLYAADVAIVDYDQFSGVNTWQDLPADIKKAAKYMGFLPSWIDNGPGIPLVRLRIKDAPTKETFRNIFKNMLSINSSSQICIEIDD